MNFDETQEHSDERDARDEIEQKLQLIKEELKQSPEVIAIAKGTDVSDVASIMKLGHEPSEEVSKFADRILRSIKIYDVESSGAMLKELTRIMSRFDRQELEDKPEGFLARMFSGGKSTITQILSKYQSLGGEIDRIYEKIAVYNKEITKNNKELEEMFEKNFEYFKELEKYSAACSLLIDHVEREQLPYWEERAKSGYGDDSIKLQEVKYALEMLRHRLYDLEMAKVVALQTAPQIRLLQKGNYKLMAKIQSAFIITIPIFKNGLIQAVTAKRQRLIAESMDALDKATNELILKNAENLKQSSIDIARVSGGEALKIETLEAAWKTISSGIEETGKIEEENRKLREEAMKKLDKMKAEVLYPRRQ